MKLMLNAMWAGNVLDIQKTLHYVCKRLLREPGISKQEAKLRAQVRVSRMFALMLCLFWHCMM